MAGPTDLRELETISRVIEEPDAESSGWARLRVVYPRALAAVIPLARPRVVLGRQPEHDEIPPLLHPTVSRRHFALRLDSISGCHVGSDLGSRNGSWVNGQRLGHIPLVLREGAVVRMGDVVAVYERGERPLPGDDAVSRDAVPGESATAVLLRAAIARAAADRSPVLISGQSGTGKESVAGELHRLSGRPGPLLTVNCAALSAQLIESQLFGHERGAFTGAVRAQAGVFRSAAGGTLFLDELGELPMELQPKLLRAVEQREVVPVGGSAPIEVDVRIVAATNRALAAEVERGGFRRDLFARLSLLEVAVPPLADRRADILGWIDRLHARWHRDRERPDPAPLEFEPEAVEAMLLAPWPENLRGLDRLVHSLAGMEASASRVTRASLPDWSQPAASPPDPAPAPVSTTPTPGGRKGRPSREELLDALRLHNGNIRATARHFGRDRRQIYRWIEHHKIELRRDS